MWIECSKQREEQQEVCCKARAFADLEMNFGFYFDQDREPPEGFIMKNDVIQVGLESITLMPLLKIGCNGTSVKTEKPIKRLL